MTLQVEEVKTALLLHGNKTSQLTKVRLQLLQHVRKNVIMIFQGLAF